MLRYSSDTVRISENKKAAPKLGRINPRYHPYSCKKASTFPSVTGLPVPCYNKSFTRSAPKGNAKRSDHRAALSRGGTLFMMIHLTLPTSSLHYAIRISQILKFVKEHELKIPRAARKKEFIIWYRQCSMMNTRKRCRYRTRRRNF